MKNVKSSISMSMERAAIRVAPRGKAATKVFAALLVLELTAGMVGCSKSKPVAQNAQESSSQTVATAPVAAIPTAPVAVNQPETAQKKSVKGPVRKLPRTLLYTDADSGFSLAYPRKSTLRTGQRAELQAIGMEWLPLNFVQQGGTTVTMLELPGATKEQESSGEFFAVSVHNGLTAEQCGKFADESAGNNSNAQQANAISRVNLHGFEYSELNRQSEQGSAKYYHRFVPGSGEISSCYEFTLAVKAPEKKAEGEGSDSQAEKRDDFARLQRVLASVKIKADSEPVKVATEPKKDNGEVPAAKSNNNETTESAKTVAKSDGSPR